MPKYLVLIEFDTQTPIKFPKDGRLLVDMQAQLESLGDGSYDDMGGDRQHVVIGDSKFIKVDE